MQEIEESQFQEQVMYDTHCLACTIEGLLKDKFKGAFSEVQMERIVKQFQFYVANELNRTESKYFDAESLLNEVSEDKGKAYRTLLMEFDQLTGGLRSGGLYVFGGQSGMGVGTILTSIVRNLLRQKVSVLFVGDYAPYELLERILNSKGNRIIKDQDVKEPDFTAKYFGNSSFHFLNDTHGIDISSKRIEELITKEKIDVVLIDSIQNLCISSVSSSHFHDELEYGVKQLKLVAKCHNVPIVFGTEVDNGPDVRGGEKRPSINDLIGISAFEYTADVITSLYRYEYYQIYEDEYGNDTSGLLELELLKNNYGDSGIIKLDFNRNEGRIPFKKLNDFSVPDKFREQFINDLKRVSEQLDKEKKRE